MHIAVLLICSFIIGAMFGYFYRGQPSRTTEPDIPMEEPPIPVIGSKKVDWDEYRDIPKINIEQPIPKFNRNNI